MTYQEIKDKLQENGKLLKQITKEDYYKKSKDYRGKWDKEIVEYREMDSVWIGKRTMLSYDERKGTVLLTEGLHFEII